MRTEFTLYTKIILFDMALERHVTEALQQTNVSLFVGECGGSALTFVFGVLLFLLFSWFKL